MDDSQHGGHPPDEPGTPPPFQESQPVADAGDTALPSAGWLAPQSDEPPPTGAPQIPEEPQRSPHDTVPLSPGDSFPPAPEADPYSTPAQPLPPPPGYAPPPPPGYAPPPPGYMPPPPPPGYAPPVVMVQARPSGTPVAVEAILALFGFYGIGWLMAGETTTGVLLLIGGFVWDAIVVVGTILTLGIGLCCFGPIHIGLVALTSVLLANHLKSGRATLS